MARYWKLLLSAFLVGGVCHSLLAADDLSPDCRDANGTHILISVENITSGEGTLRAQVYGSNPEEFLEKGKKLVRVEVEARKGETHMCVPVPGPGEYALVVMHDRNKNGKADIFSEGFGFSNNPDLGLSKPDYNDVRFEVKKNYSEQSIRMKYLLGSDADKVKRKRARRR